MRFIAEIHAISHQFQTLTKPHHFHFTSTIEISSFNQLTWAVSRKLTNFCYCVISSMRRIRTKKKVHKRKKSVHNGTQRYTTPTVGRSYEVCLTSKSPIETVAKVQESAENSLEINEKLYWILIFAIENVNRRSVSIIKSSWDLKNNLICLKSKPKTAMSWKTHKLCRKFENIFFSHLNVYDECKCSDFDPMVTSRADFGSATTILR